MRILAELHALLHDAAEIEPQRGPDERRQETESRDQLSQITHRKPSGEEPQHSEQDDRGEKAEEYACDPPTHAFSCAVVDIES